MENLNKLRWVALDDLKELMDCAKELPELDRSYLDEMRRKICLTIYNENTPKNEVTLPEKEVLIDGIHWEAI